MTTALAMFLIFIAVTLGISYWAARRSSGARSVRSRPERIAAIMCVPSSRGAVGW